MLEWNPLLIHRFEEPGAGAGAGDGAGSPTSSSLMEEADQMLNSAGYSFVLYDKTTDSFNQEEQASTKGHHISFVQQHEQYQTTDFLMVRDHPECFERKGMKWKQLISGKGKE